MRLFLNLFLILFSIPALAVTFTPEEVRVHKERIELITETASRCLDDTYQEHVDFYKKYGVSKFFGDRKPEYKTVEGRRQALASYGYSAKQIAEILPQMKGTSCIGMTMACLGKGFAAAGQEQVWQRIYDALAVDKNFYGTDLQRYLRGLGWKTLYWNPSPKMNAEWDAEDLRLSPPKTPGKWNPVWGGHAERYRSVMNKGMYYNIPVDDAATLVNFETTPPIEFKRLNFFVGTAHAGYHVFPGRRGEVIEAHSMRELKSFDNLEYSEFNPLGTGGGPRWTRTEKYRSGVIVVPPKR